MSHIDGAGEVSLAGELDLAVERELAPSFDALIGAHTRAVVINVSNVSFVDLYGLRCLAGLAQAAAERNATFRVRGLSPLSRQVIRLAELSGLEDAYDPRRNNQ